jgi:hypothetical protein
MCETWLTEDGVAQAHGMPEDYPALRAGRARSRIAAEIVPPLEPDRPQTQ